MPTAFCLSSRLELLHVSSGVTCPALVMQVEGHGTTDVLPSPQPVAADMGLYYNNLMGGQVR